MRPTNNEILAGYKLLRELHAEYEGAAKELQTALAVPLCVENCGLCCKTPVVWGVEAYYIVSAIAGSIGGLPNIMDLTEEWMLSNVIGVTTLAKENQYQVEDTKEIMSEANALCELRCPYLDLVNRCPIYEDRPISCRALGVTSIRSDCKRPLGIGESMTQKALYLGPGGLRLRQKTSSFFTLPGFLGEYGFLPAMLYRIVREEKLKELVYNGKILAAKLIVGKANISSVLSAVKSNQSRRIL